jgi:serine kinase of HPr protein (carbohydrate metabolism regulator)
MDPGTTLHASCILISEMGLLIRGPSGSGKSSLARQIVLQGQRGGRFARLVCDDRVRVENRNGRILASAVPDIAGQIEVRGIGLLTVPYETSAIVRWVIDLGQVPARLPAGAAPTVTLCGVPLPRIEACMEPGLSQAILLRLEHPGTL